MELQNPIDKDPKHQYTSNQSYSIILIVKGKGGETSITKKIDVKGVPEPNKIYLTKITVVKFPPNKPDGTPWDGCCTSVDARPDIYPTFLYGKSEIWSGEKIYVKDANPNTIYSFSVNPSIEVRFPKEKYTISLYDAFQAPFDGGILMGGATFTPVDLLKGYPIKVKVPCLLDCTIEYEIELKYEY
jgi:PKD repeat protein